MTGDRVVVLQLTTIEAAHLAGLVEQFQDLLSGDDMGDDTVSDDPAVARLTPDAYPEDSAAGREFRRLTQSDLLRRRMDDAGIVLRSLFPGGDAPAVSSLGEREALAPLAVALPHDEALAWMRTLAAVRLVIASRLGITAEDDRDDEDPRFAVYEWLGMRLDGIVEAANAGA